MLLSDLVKFELSSQTQLVISNETRPMEMLAFSKLLYIRKVHLNAVSQYDYGTIVVTARRVNIRIPTSVWMLEYEYIMCCGCTELDTVYLCSTHCTKLVLITRLLCVTSLAVASRFSPERPYVPRARERSNLSR